MDREGRGRQRDEEARGVDVHAAQGGHGRRTAEDEHGRDDHCERAVSSEFGAPDRGAQLRGFWGDGASLWVLRTNTTKETCACRPHRARMISQTVWTAGHLARMRGERESAEMKIRRAGSLALDFDRQDREEEDLNRGSGRVPANQNMCFSTAPSSDRNN